MEDITNITAGHYGMMIVMPIFILLAVLAFKMTPKPWRESHREITMIIIFHICGCTALFSLTCWYCELPSTWLRWIINYFQTFYFDFLLVSTALLLIIKLANMGYKKVRKEKAGIWNYRAIWLCTLGAIVLFATISIYHDKTIVLTEYEVANTKTAPAEDMTITLYADSHVGAGADIQGLSLAANMINAQDCDLLILDGDIVDGTTSETDLQSLTVALKGTYAKYGKYFVMGNHDDNCLYDFEKALTDAGVIILSDEAVKLPNGAILVGKNDSTNTEPTEIMNKSNISAEEQASSYIILAQHRPARAELYKTQCDLMLCGHTHGFHFPKVNPLSFFSDKLVYGIRYYDNMCAITTSGLSSWGFHTKWPSTSEVVAVHVTRS